MQKVEGSNPFSRFRIEIPRTWVGRPGEGVNYRRPEPRMRGLSCIRDTRHRQRGAWPVGTGASIDGALADYPYLNARMFSPRSNTAPSPLFVGASQQLRCWQREPELEKLQTRG
jgi:hypothetical protein